ncbi:MAG: glycosyltransferase [Chloroflexi bacterium]|nr:glycosyltransferase [Chloroflexota bacterium]
MPDLRLSLCMIVRDEEQTLERCLASVRGAVDEIVVGDTGSRDGTVALAERLGARVVHIPWRDDFAWARNQVVEQATGHWILSLDADEEVAAGTAPRLRELIASPEARLRCYRLLLRHHQPDGSAIEYYYGRLFPRHPAVRYVSPIHEAVVHLEDRDALEYVTTAEVVVDHWGYAQKAIGPRWERNLRLLASAAASSPDDPFYAYKIGQHYLDGGRYREALEHLERAIALAGATRYGYVAQAYGAAVCALIQLGLPARAVTRGRAGTKRYPDYPALWYYLGTAHLLAGDSRPAEHCYARARSLHGVADEAGREHYQLDRSMVTWRPLHGLGAARLLAGDVAGALRAFQDALSLAPDQPDALLGAAQALLRLERPAEALPLLERFATQRPGDDEAEALLARCRIATGAWQVAYDQLDTLVRAEPGRRLCREALADVLLAAGEPAAALDVLGPALDPVGAAAPFYRQAARALRELGHADDAANAEEMARLLSGGRPR